MFLVSYFAVLSKKTHKGTTKNAHTQVKRAIFAKNDRFYLSHRPIAIHRKLACIWMAIGYDKC